MLLGYFVIRHSPLIGPELGFCSSEDTTRQISSSLLEESIAKAGTLSSAAPWNRTDMLSQVQRHSNFADEFDWKYGHRDLREHRKFTMYDVELVFLLFVI